MYAHFPSLKTHPVLQKIYNSNIMAMQNLENRMQRESLSEYVELEKELFQNKFRVIFSFILIYFMYLSH